MCRKRDEWVKQGFFGSKKCPRNSQWGPRGLNLSREDVLICLKTFDYLTKDNCGANVGPRRMDLPNPMQRSSTHLCLQWTYDPQIQLQQETQGFATNLLET